MSQFKQFWGFLVLALTSAIAPATSADAANLTATIKLKSLPTSITLCRDPTAHADPGYGIDEQWQMAFDVDNNATTGAGGQDIILVAQPTPVSNPCSPSTVATQGNIVAALFKWNGSTFEITNATVDVAFDFAGATMTLTTPATGDLAGLSANSKVNLTAAAPYSSGAAVNVASDSTTTFNLGSSVVAPPSDVQNCSGPCNTGASWYPLVDVTGASATIGQVINTGGNTIDIEFDVAALHSTIGICRYPAAFTQDGLSDSEWVAQFNITGVDDGAGAGGYNTAVFVITPQQSTSCSPSTLPTTAALSGVLAQFDSSFGGYVAVEIVPLDINIASGKIIAHAPTSTGFFGGLSSNSLVAIGTQALYANAQPAADGLPTAFHYGAGAQSDAASDLQGCSSPCSTAQPWYQEVDLRRVTVTSGEHIFSSSFE